MLVGHVASASKTKSTHRNLVKQSPRKKKYLEDPGTHGKITLEWSLNTEIWYAVDSTGS